MTNEAVLFLLLSMLFLALFVLGARNIELWEKRAKYAQALLAFLALVTTGYWFFVERKGMPHADVTQTLEVVPLGEGVIAVEAHIQIKNLGQRLLKIERINSRLQLVRADAYDYLDLSRIYDDNYWLARRPNSDEPQFASAELRWPSLRQYKGELDHEIEPGETDLLVATFLMNCSMTEKVRVASDVYKPSTSSLAALQAKSGTEDFRDLAWKARTFADLTEACESLGGE